ncbi:hypothetical protein ABZP36_034802 [Zizania latifolia]
MAVLLAVIAYLCVLAAGQDDNLLHPGWPTCSTTGNYTDGSQYKKNLNLLLSTLSAGATAGGWFYNSTVGAGDDQVFGLLMCYADRNGTQCHDCLTRGPAGIARICSGSRSVSAAYDACLLRYSDEQFFSTANPHKAFYVYITAGPVDQVSMAAARSSLMDELAKTAADSPLLLANSSTPYPGSPEGMKMQGLVQCTRDLTAGQCTWCLTTYIAKLPEAFPNYTGGAIKGYSCYVRYQIGAFLITLPPAMPPPPSPSKPAPPG